MAESRLFKPLKIGNMTLKHRIGMAPLTRMRASDDRVPGPLMTEYYSQRAAVPGTLIITEGTFVSASACGGFPNAPGIWTEEQVAAWKTITDEVHRKGCYVFCQLFAQGRAAMADTAEKDGVTIVGPSAIPIDEDSPTPRAMTIEEIHEMVGNFATAATNAISAGFDGVEVHGANGYLVDQFIQDNSNQRDDQYGGSVENRSRFLDEILSAIVAAVGSDRVGLRLSPWSPFQGMKMKNPIRQYMDVVGKASTHNLAYLHLVQSRVSGSDDIGGTESLDFAYKLWNRPLLIAGGYDLKGAYKVVDEEYPDKEIMVIFGRQFLANPDLVYRFKEGLKLNTPNRETFYIHTAEGYVDYPFSGEYLASEKVLINGAH